MQCAVLCKLAASSVMLRKNHLGEPMKNVASALALFALMASAVFGQTVGATVQGTISDPSGAVLPGVQIVARNTGTGTTNETISDERGSYRITLLQSGEYELE